MDIIMHVIGACSDTHAHIDLIDILLLGGASVPTVTYIKYKVKTLINNVRGRRKY